MPAKSFVFIDTNIWLYAFLDTGETEKSARARELFRKSETMLSTQVVNEVCVNLIKKAGFSEEQIAKLIQSFYEKYPIVEMDEDILLTASQLRQEYGFSYWDSLVVSCALAVNAETLYSEDMQDGLIVRGELKIINPLK
jgi:predicted nucleic acid-binding protein